MSLTDQDRAILDFEASWWKYAGAKEGEILSRFGLSAPAYYGRLNWLIDQADAEAYAPMTVRRLRRLRDVRAGARVGRREGFRIPNG
jgi:hypothetical protein